MAEDTLPTQLNQRIVASLSQETLLTLYGLSLSDFLQERKDAGKAEDLVNYKYGNFFADLHGQPQEFPSKVKEYCARLISEGWEPISWHAPLVRDINSGGLEVVKVVSVRLRARRLRADVTLRR